MINAITAILIFLIALPYAKSVNTEVTNITLDTHNTVTINTVVTGSSMKEATEQLKKLSDLRGSKNYPIYIVLDSPGGSVFAGNKFIRYAKTVPNVHTICIVCISMAHAIVQSLPGTRFATPDNVTMAHPVSVTIQGRFEQEHLESFAKMMNSLNKQLGIRNAKRIGISFEVYKKRVQFEWWTVGEESIHENVVDKITNIKCTKALEDIKIKTKQMTIFGPIDGPDKSACPLL